MNTFRTLILGIFPVCLSACGLDLVSSNYDDKVPESKPYQCTRGDWDGPQVINGKKLTGTGPLGKGLVFLMHEVAKGSTSVSLCTGTLIGNDMILTAAHCVDSGIESTRAERLFVIFGNDPMCTLTKREASNARMASKVIIHPEWASGKAGGVDLALIKLSTPAPDNAVRLAVTTDLPSLSDDRVVYGAGYGRTTDYSDAEGEAPFLRIAKIKPQNKSPNLGIMNNPSSRKLIFDQSGGEALCKGDSGGPAIILDGGQLKVMGVASYVYDPNKSTCKSLVVHTSVSYYRDWLSETYDQLRDRKSSANPFR